MATLEGPNDLGFETIGEIQEYKGWIVATVVCKDLWPPGVALTYIDTGKGIYRLCSCERLLDIAIAPYEATGDDIAKLWARTGGYPTFAPPLKPAYSRINLAVHSAPTIGQPSIQEMIDMVEEQLAEVRRETWEHVRMGEGDGLS